MRSSKNLRPAINPATVKLDKYTAPAVRPAPRHASSDVGLLTYAAEELGYARRDYAVPILKRMLAHPSPVVREGAVYGLERQGELDALREHLLGEESPGVQAAIRDAVAP